MHPGQGCHGDLVTAEEIAAPLRLPLRYAHTLQYCILIGFEFNSQAVTCNKIINFKMHLISCDSESTAKEENTEDSLPKHEVIQERDQSENGEREKKEKKLKSQGAQRGVESTGIVKTTQEPQVLPERKGGPHQKLLIKPGGLWYDLVSTNTVRW